MARKYPSYTIEMLKATVAKGTTQWCNEDQLADIQQEIDKRENGTSVYTPAPQIAWR